MLVHCLTLTFTETADPADVEAFRDAIARLPSQMDVPFRTRQGVDLGERATNADYAVVSEFANAEDFRRYLIHPAHLAVPREHVRSAQSVQFVVGDDD
ncbi:stress responsive alpha/beta barrel protein [Pseudonocardia autotrophica]|uniref:Stress responsive A/B Barrel Domain protein n=3 Tax=Pseudonocardiaceae TaxID=2070 RepID=A0A1Y2MSN0_PSEAH|nr:Stress responsive A/B Barrel Domain protein [Pseudonocardia autotrophica]TDN71049.1 stress responsive alpha/beta barrel protein [Pseudonocardia autotrophica]GEC27407.1 stress protein [Pseudonocardia saturnea]